MINVLCLHSCNQNEGMFRDLMKNYVRFDEELCEIR